VQREDTQFAGQVEAVAAFGFDGGGAMFGKALEKEPRARLQLLGGGSAQFADRIEYPSALLRNLFIADALNL